MASACAHIDAIQTVIHPKTRACEECVKIGSLMGAPAHLSVVRRHAVLRFVAESSRVQARARQSTTRSIASAEPGERWLYCYPDDAFAEY